jgi:hypothetical protein
LLVKKLHADIPRLYYKILGLHNSLTCINAGREAFEKYDPNKILSLMMNYNETLKYDRCNKNAVPHITKVRAGLLPVTLWMWKLADEVLKTVMTPTKFFEKLQ